MIYTRAFFYCSAFPGVTYIGTFDWKKSNCKEVYFFDGNHIDLCQLFATKINDLRNFVRIKCSSVKFDFPQVLERKKNLDLKTFLRYFFELFVGSIWVSVKGLFILLSALPEMIVAYFDQYLVKCCTLQTLFKISFSSVFYVFMRGMLKAPPHIPRA